MREAQPVDVGRSAVPVAAWGHLVLAEVRMVCRDTAGLVVPLGLPLLLLVMWGLSTGPEELPGTGGMTAFEVFGTPVALMVILATIGVVNMPSFLATYRRTGVLKQLSTTPVHPVMVLLAQVVTSLAQTALGVALALTVGRLAFDLAAPRDLAAAIGVLLLATAAMFSVGLLVAAISPTPGSSVAIGMVVFFVMGAVGGMFGPTDVLPDAMVSIGEVTPFGAGRDGLQAAWTGDRLPVRTPVGLIVWTVVPAVLAARLFRWS